MNRPIAALAAALFFLPAGPEARVFEVSDGNYFELRNAIRQANETSDRDTILLAEFGNYRPSGPLELERIDSRIQILGRGATINGDRADGGRMFYVGEQGRLNVADLNVIGITYESSTLFFDGGVLKNQGATVLRNVSITGTRITVDTGPLFGPVIANEGDLQLVNVTLSDNEVSGDAISSAIYNTGDLQLENATITNNRVASPADQNDLQAIVMTQDDQWVTTNSIVAGNPNGNCNLPAQSNGGNIDDDGSCGLDQPSDQPDTDPMLGPLDDHGGGMRTHNLQAGSPALNAGESLGCTPMDARGMPRPVAGSQGSGSRCDSGAFERNSQTAGFNNAVTGSWFDPQQSGHGYMVEMLPGDVVLVTWFVFDPAGNRDWVQAVGRHRDGIAKMPAHRSVGGAFPPAFDPDETELDYWGTLSLVMHGCDTASTAWMSDVPGYAPGGMPLTRLTNVAGLSCP